MLSRVNSGEYEAWMLDPSEGWCAVRGLSLDRAIQYCKDYKKDWGETTMVALVPEGINPESYFVLAETR